MPFGAAVDDVRHGGQRLDIVDRRGHPEHAGCRRERRPDARVATLALDGIHERGFLAADVRSGPSMDVHIQPLPAAHGIVTQHTVPVRIVQCGLHDA